MSKLLYYNLEHFLEATKCFENQEGGNKRLEEMLRSVEAKASGIPLEQVDAVSSDSIISALVQMGNRCLDNVLSAMFGKFEELGYVPEEREVVVPSSN